MARLTKIPGCKRRSNRVLKKAACVSFAIALSLSLAPHSNAVEPPSGDPESNQKLLPESGLPTNRTRAVFLSMNKYGEAIIEGLQVMGVRIRYSRMCPDSALAAYGRYDNLLLLCSSLNASPELITEAVAHEAVHALHDCVQEQGIDGGNSVALISFFERSGDVERVERFKAVLRSLLIPRPSTTQRLFRLKSELDARFFLMEYEAYALEADPPKVLSLINKIGIARCGGSEMNKLRAR